MQKAIIFLSIIEFILIVYLLFRKSTAHIEDKGSTNKAISNDNNKSIQKVEQELMEARNTLQQKEKEIKQLKDEVEDLEDEIDDQNKKYKEEKKTLNTEIDTYKVKLEQTQAELAEQCTLNVKQSENIELKKDALGLVGHLLMAKPQKDSDVSEQKIQNIDSLSEFILEEFKAFFDENGSQGFKNSEEWDFLFNSGFSEWKCSAKKQWLDNKTAIAFVGEFSAGKTSIVNKILSMNNSGNALQLPVSTKATTAVPTYISRGAGDSYSFYTPDNQLKSLTKSAFEMVSKEVLDELSGISNLIKYFVMTCKNLPFKNMSILDTPGFASNDKEDSLRTIEVINECDALFWVVDVNAGDLNETSYKIIEEYVKKPLYVIINKTDSKNYAESVEVKTRIESTLAKKGIKAEKIMFYNNIGKHNAKIEDIVNVINSIKQTRKSSEYIEDLKQFCSEIKEKYQKKKEELRSKMFESRKKLLECIDIFEKTLRSVQSENKLVENLPRHTSKGIIFKEYLYELTENDFMELKGRLNKINVNILPNIESYVYEMKKLVQELDQKTALYDQQKLVSDEYERLFEILCKKIEILEKKDDTEYI